MASRQEMLQAIAKLREDKEVKKQEGRGINTESQARQRIRLAKMQLALPVSKLRREIPFGYEEDHTNKDFLLPNEEHFKLLLKAKRMLEAYSYEELAAWLRSQTKKELSAHGLRKILLTRPPLDDVALPLEERELLFYGI